METFGGGRQQFSECPQIKIRFGRIRYRQKGRIARFLCNTGYMLAGDRYSICVRGQWDNAFPKCVRATCFDGKPPANGLIYPSHAGAVLNFYCKSNYELRGHNITYCDGKRWDNPLPTCLPTNSTPPLSCDFESSDLCGWNHDLNHDFDWKRLNFQTPSGSIGTGPSFDHTKGPGKDGYYMYIESSARNVNDTARLISPIYDKTTTNTCFEFYYHMYGATTGDLRVYLKKFNETWDLEPQNSIFAKKGNQGNKWYKAFLKLGPINDDFQIIIEGVRGASYVSDIAIDDVKIIKNCTPESEPTTIDTLMSSEPPVVVESCENRCSLNDTQDSNEFFITCDCDEKCFERNRCCPDYYDFCIFGTSSDDFTEETTELPTTTRMETPRRTTTMATTTTATTTIIATTTTKLTTRPTKKEESKIIYVTPDDVEDVPMKKSNQIQTEPVKEIELINDYENDKAVKQKIVIPHHESEGNMKTIVFAVGVVFGVLFGVVGMAFVARRYRLFPCNNLRKMNQSSNGDSQSDVRFLTSDEVLDFSLPGDYDTL